MNPSRPRLLDLFCGAGGAGMGYHRAGFDVVGVDINPQPHYPFEFHQGDAMTWPLEGFDVIHASPPCQAFSAMKTMHNAKHHDDLLTPMRERLKEWGGTFVIENVPGAPMDFFVVMCGSQFGLSSGDAELRRHRWFEVPFLMLTPPCQHDWKTETIPVYGPHGTPGFSHKRKAKVIGVYGGHGRDRSRSRINMQGYSVEARREAMGIDWMTGAELSQAIPPAYTEFIGVQLLAHIDSLAA